MVVDKEYATAAEYYADHPQTAAPVQPPTGSTEPIGMPNPDVDPNGVTYGPGDIPETAIGEPDTPGPDIPAGQPGGPPIQNVLQGPQEFGGVTFVDPNARYQPVAVAPQAPATYYGSRDMASGLGYVDPTRSTVAGQLATLLGTDSPYIAEARRQGLLQAAQQGGTNSTAAASAAQRAAYEAAMPIVAQDASTYASAQGREQEGEIASTLSGQNATQQSGLSAQSAFQDRILSAQNAMQQAGLSVQDAALQAGLSAQEASQLSMLSFQDSLQASGLSAQEALQQSGLSAQEYIQNSGLSTQNSWQDRLLAADMFGYDTSKLAQQIQGTLTGIGMNIEGNLGAIGMEGSIQAALDKQAQDNAVVLADMGIAADEANVINQITGNYGLALLNNAADILRDPNITNVKDAFDTLFGLSMDTTWGQGAIDIDLTGDTADITAAYTEKLGRAPTEADINYWSNVEGGFNMDAFNQAAQGEIKQNSIVGAYRDILGREPAPAEIEAWMNAGDFNIDTFRAAAQAELGGA
jgi:hypothetical protein